jgi:hypothetical protein
MSARPSAWNNSAPTGCIFMKFDICVFFENRLRKLIFYYNLTRITGTLHEDQYTYLIISRSLLLRIINISDKIGEKIKTRILCLVTIFLNSALYGIMWKNIVQPGRPQMTI